MALLIKPATADADEASNWVCSPEKYLILDMKSVTERVAKRDAGILLAKQMPKELRLAAVTWLEGFK